MMNIQTHAETGVSLPVAPWERPQAAMMRVRASDKPNQQLSRPDRLLRALTIDWQSRHAVLNAADAGRTEPTYADLDRLVSQGLAEVWHDQRTKQHVRRYRLTAKGSKAQRGLA